MPARKANNHVSYHPWANLSYPLSLKIASFLCVILLTLEVVLVEAMQLGFLGTRVAENSGQAGRTVGAGANILTPLPEGGVPVGIRGAADPNQASLEATRADQFSPQARLGRSRGQFTLGSLGTKGQPSKLGTETIKTKIPKKSLKEMPNYYEGRFYKTENFIGKDENNLYRALAHLEYQDQEMHAVVAKDIEQYIRKNPDQFKDYRISRFGWPARKVNDKASTIRIGSRKYLYVNAEGNGGALFSAFKKTTSSEYAVLHKLPANTEGEMPTYIGSEYSNTKDKNLHQRISKGLVLENGHYEVFARPGSEALSMVPPKAKRT